MDRDIEVAIGRREDPTVHLDRLVAPQPLDSPLGEGTKKFRLKMHGHLPDLVQKERPALGLLESSDAPLAGAGEGALFKAEELRLQKRVGNRGRRDGDEWARGARGRVVNRLGETFLAGTARPAQ